MFTSMVASLKAGTLPDNSLLRKRFTAALVKKMGIIKTPYPFWPTDPKINPPAKQLLWAATLLQDKENFELVAAIISTEMEERLQAQGRPASMRELGATVQELLHQYLHEFIDLAPDFASEIDRYVTGQPAK